jgi:signal transduction histidine kinase
MYAMDSGGEIEIAANVVSENVVVSVTDSGPGVPVPVQEKIFDAFFTTKPKGEGLGLGLFLSRQIVHDHGGEISYERKDEKSIFTVVLPRKNDK